MAMSIKDQKKGRTQLKHKILRSAACSLLAAAVLLTGCQAGNAGSSSGASSGASSAAMQTLTASAKGIVGDVVVQVAQV